MTAVPRPVSRFLGPTVSRPKVPWFHESKRHKELAHLKALSLKFCVLVWRTQTNILDALTCNILEVSHDAIE